MVHPREECESAEKEELPFGPGDTLAIMFDAGLPGMPLLGCSSALAKCGVGDDTESLLDLAPEDEADDLDDWIFTEVQNLEESGAARSTHLTTLKLELPRFKSRQLEAKTAWLEVPPGTIEMESEDSIPMVLKVQGLADVSPATLLRRRQERRSTLKMPKRRQSHYGSGGTGGEGSLQLGSVPEGDEETEEAEEPC